MRYITSIRKIMKLLRNGYHIGEVKYASSSRNLGHWDIYHPDLKSKLESFSVPVLIIEEKEMPNGGDFRFNYLEKVNPDKWSSSYKLKEPHILHCSRGCRINTEHVFYDRYKPGDICPHEISYDRMSGTTYCKRILF